MKAKLNNKNDLCNWFGSNTWYNLHSYAEAEPKEYPCLIIWRVIDNHYRIGDDVYYEFVYFKDFQTNQLEK